jgi:heme ABC exporter, ATP-binding protein CcmA
MLLSVERLEIERDDRVLFSPITFDLLKGEIIKITGENGAGKSSILRAILGFLSISDGSIRYLGGHSKASYAEFLKEVLYIGHTTGVKDSLTVRENLTLLNGPLRDDQLIKVVNRLQLQDCLEQLCRQLSAGQKKRVALASLWLTTSSIWVLDEPIASLDSSGQSIVEGALLDHLKEGGAVIMTTHQALTIPHYKEIIVR